MKKLLLLLFFAAIFKAQTVSSAEKAALINLYATTGGINWAIGWDLEKAPNTWYGIKTENGFVTEIKLNSNNLSGTLPSFSEFQNLKVLYLNANNISGEISGLPANLQELDLSENNLSGDVTAAVSALTNLKVLNLGDNNFSASNFSFLQNFSGLKSLNLSGFNLQKVPDAVAKLPSLTELNLSNNSINGFSALSSLQKLEELQLSGNAMKELPTEISALKNLKTLNLSNNALTKFSVLSSLQNLEWLSLENNDLKEIPAELSAAKNLFSLNLSSNEISNFGTLNQLKNLQQLFINKNNLTKIPAEIDNLKQLQLLSLIGNQLSGAISQSVPDFTFIQNNRYSLQDIQNLLATGRTFTNIDYSPQRYDEPVTISAAKGSEINLKQNLSSAEDYQFFWYKNLDESIGQKGENYHIADVKTTDYGKYTAEAYYLKLLSTGYFEMSFFREPITFEEGILATLETLSGIYIYPNPTSDFLHIRSENEKIESASVYDLSGKLLFTEKSNRLNVGYLPSSVYVLVLKTANGIKSFKFIKK